MKTSPQLVVNPQLLKNLRMKIYNPKKMLHLKTRSASWSYQMVLTPVQDNGPSATKPKAQRKGQPAIVDNVDDDEETYPQRKSHPKKSQSKATFTSIDSSDDSDSVQITSAKKKQNQVKALIPKLKRWTLKKKLLRKNLVSYQKKKKKQPSKLK